MSQSIKFLRENWLGLLIVVALPLAWFGLRSEASPFVTLKEFEQLLASGHPTVVDFFSNG